MFPQGQLVLVKGFGLVALVFILSGGRETVDGGYYC